MTLRRVGIDVFGSDSAIATAHLSGLTYLKVLRLYDSNVTDAGLQHLSGLSNLQELYLGNTQVTDGGLQHLSGLNNLLLLDLRNTQVTDASVDELQSQLPGVEIVR